MTTYVLAGGCFWCLDAVFRQLSGVTESMCGYAGDTQQNASYYRVASGLTNHAESVQVTFDETLLPRNILLDIFMLIHDPTSLNRQGSDVGPQYRSAMFYIDTNQQSEFEAAKHRASVVWNRPLVTELSELDHFYPAEPEHQDYFAQHPEQGYCQVVISPKVLKAREHYTQFFKS